MKTYTKKEVLGLDGRVHFATRDRIAVKYIIQIESDLANEPIGTTAQFTSTKSGIDEKEVYDNVLDHFNKSKKYVVVGDLISKI